MRIVVEHTLLRKNVNDIWMPTHLTRISSTIDDLLLNRISNSLSNLSYNHRSLTLAAIWNPNLGARTRRTTQPVKPGWFTIGYSGDINANGLQREEESLILQLEDYQDEGMKLCEGRG
jgi:hypothetical protein